MHHLPVHEAVVLLESDRTRGLGEGEAAARRERHGPNVLPRVERRGPLVRLALQFHHPLIYTLLVASVVAFAVGERVDAAVILGVVVANAIIGFLQESRAEHALEALQRMMTSASRVVRDGRERVVPATELVPGDLVVLETGDKVAADARLLEEDELQVDESALTGESVPVEKDEVLLDEETVLADRRNMVFSGTLVTSGSGRAVVVATAGDTELGLIHRLLGETTELATPLTRRLAGFSRVLTVVILVLAVVTWGIGLARGEDAADMLVAAVALAVAAIPEGLPAAVTIALAIGVSRMARRHAIVRRLPAVETLGSTTVICTDKTGTLTENEMTVQAVVSGGRRYAVTGEGYRPRGTVLDGDRPISGEGGGEGGGHGSLRDALHAAALCGDGDAVQRNGSWQAVGDPTEAALVVAARKLGIERERALERRPRVDVLPFDSERRFMATVHADGGDGRVTYVKGAVEEVAAMCDARAGDGGEDRPLDRDEVLAAARSLAADGLRVLAVAGTAGVPPDLERPRGLTLLGLLAMIDPPRAEAARAVRACHTAGVEVKMITGDHAETARAIAGRVGLLDEGAPADVVAGAEMARWEPSEVARMAARARVFARVSAEQKLVLVRALQADGEVVAMTGDGVNDAPALRQADIGVSMGEGGTEVAREASDIILSDDNFASIEAAVEEGRHTFDNLRKFLVYALPTNIGQALLLLTAIVIGATLPILPVQILWINLTTAVLLGLTLAFERVEPGVMLRPPRHPREPLLSREMIRRMLLASALLVVAAFALFEYEIAAGATDPVARTVAINAFVAVELLYLFSCRSLRAPAHALGLLSNRWLLAGVATMVVVQLGLTYWGPMNDLFDTAPIDLAAWARILAAAVIAWLVIEAEKHLRNRLDRPGRAGVPARPGPDGAPVRR